LLDFTNWFDPLSNNSASWPFQIQAANAVDASLIAGIRRSPPELDEDERRDYSTLPGPPLAAPSEVLDLISPSKYCPRNHCGQDVDRLHPRRSDQHHRL